MKGRIIIFLLVNFVMLLCSCEKKNITSNDNSENNEDKLFSDNSRKTENEIFPKEIKPIKLTTRTPEIPYYKDKEVLYGYKMLLEPYRYDGYWSMRFGEYFSLDDKEIVVKNKEESPPEFKDMSGLYKLMMEE